MQNKWIATKICFKDHIQSAKLCDRLYTYNKKNTLIFHEKRKKKIFVVLQGTNNLYHWMHNISILPTKDDGLHTGFNEYADVCKQELLNTITNERLELHMCDINKIYFTAHSLGASAILILVYKLLKESIFTNYIKDVNIDIVLFGAPKSGNMEFIRNFHSILLQYPTIKLYRYNVQYDFVKHYPPILTYSHICKDITLYSDSTSIMNILYNHSIKCYVDCMIHHLNSEQS